MKVVISIDSFKGSLSTFRANQAAAAGVRRVFPEAEVITCPLADGGEGTVSALVASLGGEICRAEVMGPLGAPVVAEYGWIPSRQTAVIEMAAAAGITLVSQEERNPLHTTTYGVGQLILHALEKGCRKFIIGIGGSATNDGGAGMLSALGFQFLDAMGAPIARGVAGLSTLAEIKTEGKHPLLSECSFSVACDVTNPLCGADGCSAVFGPQKGATPEMVEKMDVWLQRYAAIAAASTGADHSKTPGAGAAGGLGFAFLSYLGASLKSGIRLVLQEADFAAHLAGADAVITGEGRLDGQTCMGKAPIGVAEAAKKQGIPVIAFSGCITAEAGLCNAHGIDAFFSILPAPCTLGEAMEEEAAYKNLQNTVEQAFRWMACFFKK